MPIRWKPCPGVSASRHMRHFFVKPVELLLRTVGAVLRHLAPHGRGIFIPVRRALWLLSPLCAHGRAYGPTSPPSPFGAPAMLLRLVLAHCRHRRQKCDRQVHPCHSLFIPGTLRVADNRRRAMPTFLCAVQSQSYPKPGAWPGVRGDQKQQRESTHRA